MGRLWNDAKGSRKEHNLGQVLTTAQVNKLHKLLLMMIQDVDSICRSNNLQYVLIGGTAIGCVRHKGFIPWDDDVDIAMPRSDYEKFVQIINSDWSEKYSLTDSLRNNNYGKVIPKLRLNGTIYRTVLDVDPSDVQMKSDIYIIENVPDNVLIYQMQGILCTFMGFFLSCRRLAARRNYFSKLYKGKDFKFKVGIGSCLSFLSLNTWANWTEKCYSFCKNDASKYVTLPSDGLHFFGGTIRREVICDSTEGNFEGIRVYLPKEYDFYLRRIYGDYMQIPPEEKRLLSMYSEIDFGKYSNYVNDI